MRGGHTYTVPEVKNKNASMDIVLNDAEGPVNQTDTAILEKALRKSYRIFQCLIQQSPACLEHSDCDCEMKEDLVLTDALCKVRQDLGSQAPDHDLFSEKDIAEFADMCDEYLKLGVHVHIFCSSVQPSSLVKAISAATRSVTFKDSQSNEQL